jgi:hypothetical protein
VQKVLVLGCDYSVIPIRNPSGDVN